MQGNNNALKNRINLVPKKLLIYQKLKIVQWIVLGLCLVALVLMTVFAVQGYMQIDDLNKELAEDKQIIAEGHLDELNALKAVGARAVAQDQKNLHNALPFHTPFIYIDAA